MELICCVVRISFKLALMLDVRLKIGNMVRSRYSSPNQLMSVLWANCTLVCGCFVRVPGSQLEGLQKALVHTNVCLDLPCGSDFCHQFQPCLHKLNETMFEFVFQR